MSNKLSFYTIIPVVFLLFLNGCATAPGSAHFLREDSHSSDLYKAVIFGKVKINARFPIYEDRLFMALWRINSKPDPSNINLITAQFSNPEKDEKHTLEVPFALEVIPGTYDLRSVGFSNGYLPERIRFTPKGDYVDNDEKKGYHQIQYQIGIGSGEMLYLGTIAIDVKEKTESYSTNTNTYKYTFKFEDNFKQDLDSFKNAYPSIFHKYAGKIRKQ